MMGLNRTMSRKTSCWVATLLLLTVIIILSCRAGHADTTGAEFLKVEAGARPAGMADAYSAAGDDANCLWSNPAGLGLMEHGQISLTHNIWFYGAHQEAVNWAQPYYNTLAGTVGFGLNYFSMGNVDGMTASGEAFQYQAYDLAVNLAYGTRWLFDSLQGGVNVKFFNQKIENESSWGTAFDIGGLYRTQIEDLYVGLLVRNIGPSVKFIDEKNNLPLCLTLGASGRILDRHLLLSAEASKPKTENVVAAAGAEYNLNSNIALRTGYRLGGNNADGFNIGIGLSLQSFVLDYGLTQHSGLDYTHQISLTYNLGMAGKKEEPKPERICGVRNFRLYGVEPRQGPQAGGTSLTITGNGFQEGVSVDIDGPCRVIAVSPTTLNVLTRIKCDCVQAYGEVDVIVTNPESGIATLNRGFRYISAVSVKSVLPDTGPLSAGTELTVSGGWFLDGAKAAIAGRTIADVKVLDRKTIALVLPELPVQPSYDLVITNPDTGSVSYNFAPHVSPPQARPVIPAQPVVILAETIHFNFNSQRLGDRDKEVLNRVLELMKAQPDCKLQVAGHTDNVGSEKYNQALSEKRADAVKMYLESLGISPGRIEASGYGFSQPKASNDTEEGRSTNRRTELILIR